MKVCLRVSLLTIATFFCFSDAVAAQNDAVRGNALALPQGWSADTIDLWHFISQGTTLIPHEWFLALEQSDQKELIRSPGNLQRLGFLNEPAGQNNPDGLPVGLYKWAVNFDYGKYACWKGNWLGLGCAGCHTGQVNYHGKQIRIEGGPSRIDIENFVRQLKLSLGRFAQDPQALASFVERVRAPAADVQKGLACFAKVLGAEKEFYSNKDLGTPAGYGRLDAHGIGLNQLFAVPLGENENYAPRPRQSDIQRCGILRASIGCCTTAQSVSRWRATSSKPSACWHRSSMKRYSEPTWCMGSRWTT